MRSTMQDIPLTVTRLLVHGALAHGTSQVTTWTGTTGGAEPDRRTFLASGVRAIQLARALHEEFGVDSGDTVATLMANTADHLESYLAVPAMGAVLHPLDPWLPADELVAAAASGGAKVLLTDAIGLAPLASVLPRLKHVRHIVVAGGGSGSGAVIGGTACGAEVHDYEELIADRPRHYDWPEIDERDAAVLCHTTETHGSGYADVRARGVAYSHRALYLHAIQAQTPQAYGIGEHDLVLSVVPMSRMLAWGLPYAAFAGGASLLLPGAYDQPAPLAEMAETERPSLVVADLAVWEGLRDELDALPRDLSSLREAVVVGGPGEEPGGPFLVRELGRRHGISTAAAWGAPGTLSPACVARAASGEAGRSDHYRFPASVEYGVTGPDLSPLPWDGESEGELLLRGPWITASYVEEEAPLHEGWLRTGETAAITPDGRVAIKSTHSAAEDSA
ncbi:AMP-binding protein [Streptomyces sp. NBC_01795]|uniref:AMP-binding protein n=1 Tax=unclassified Streptomyces TaxID=2593676 RepID=UPI002DDC69CC|nr:MULTISPECIES: AMP-binding protein [unclassified Streptomyces]WSA93978.1 AMP-binding protein [Streptomyces sp. NBC_01795]WSB78404.1 AMP-binding protein [Streptomyces sp. NBC_01775]WSS13394.1 AMP-binding protein [Streptomyces sp. NBC_01186]